MFSRNCPLPLEDVGKLSKSSESPEKVSSICAVLAETDVINMVARGISTPDILKGIHLSIAGRVVQLIRAVGAEGKVVLTGGLSRDEGIVAAIEQTLEGEGGKKSRKPQVQITVKAFPESILAGALGAALIAARRFDQLERKRNDEGARQHG